jgi:hypothetical protein
MPIYLVRWQDLSAALVSARNESELIDTLDELADSEGVSWSVYRGPLWVEFEVPVQLSVPDSDEDGSPLKLEDIKVSGTEDVEAGALEMSAAGCETGSAMKEAVYRRAFPALHRVLYGRHEPDDAAVDGALRVELKRLVEARWRIANRTRRTDPIGRIAVQMRAPVRWVEEVLRRSGDLPPDEGPPQQRKARVRPLKSKTRSRNRKR